MADPASGKWSDKKEEVICKGEGKWGTQEMDQNWSKDDLCRDHGNGLEVVCIEKYYQDVRENLTSPDLAVMFSPGFPQLARRTWDTVLIGLLNTKVPLMISDVITVPSWGYKLTLPQYGYKTPVPPGGRWYPNASAHFGEDWQTWLAMKKYGAQKIKARRGPFPILHRENGEVLAKNAVVQIYEGYRPKRQPTKQLSDSDIRMYAEKFESINWKQIGSKACPASVLKKAFAFPTSRAFDNALRDMYIDDFVRRAHKHRNSFNQEQIAKFEKYGVLKSGKPDGQKRKLKHWDLNTWAFLYGTLGCEEY